MRRTVRVKAGDTLWGIAKRLTGSGARWCELFSANWRRLPKGPDLIYPGQEFVLPCHWPSP